MLHTFKKKNVSCIFLSNTKDDYLFYLPTLPSPTPPPLPPPPPPPKKKNPITTHLEFFYLVRSKKKNVLHNNTNIL